MASSIVKWPTTPQFQPRGFVPSENKSAAFFAGNGSKSGFGFTAKHVAMASISVSSANCRMAAIDGFADHFTSTCACLP